MSNECYIVNCYTCQHNGQETCKGCNTLLNGEDEPYQNWKLREDLQYRDNKIENLQSQLAEKDQAIESLQEINQSLGQTCNNDAKEIERLREQLAEKDKEIEELKKELRDELVDNNMAILELQQSQKQLAIEELKKIYNLFEPYENSQKDTILCANNGISFIDYLENQIKELKGESR